MIIIGILLLFILFGGMIGAVYMVMKKTDPKNVDTSLRDDISTSQEFLPFVDIKDSMIALGNHDYRAVIEVGSINYDLKSAQEKETIEIGYARFLNSLNFDITFFLATREIDNTTFMENLRADYEKTLMEFPALEEFANQNYADMLELNNYLGVTRQKKKYIIIPYNESNQLSMQSDEEKYEYSKRELATRVRVIREGLSSIGLTSKVLSTKDILELLILTYYRDGKSHVEQVWNKEFTSMIVEGNNIAKGMDLSPEEELDAILTEMEERLKINIFSNHESSEDTREEAERMFKAIREARRSIPNISSLKEQEKYYEEIEKTLVGVRKNDVAKEKVESERESTQNRGNNYEEVEYDEF